MENSTENELPFLGTTQDVARITQRKYHNVYQLVMRNKIPSPRKNSTGDLVWSQSDLANAIKAFEELDSKKRNRDKQPKSKSESQVGAAE